MNTTKSCALDYRISISKVIKYKYQRIICLSIVVNSMIISSRSIKIFSSTIDRPVRKIHPKVVNFIASNKALKQLSFLSVARTNRMELKNHGLFEYFINFTYFSHFQPRGGTLTPLCSCSKFSAYFELTSCSPVKVIVCCHE